MYILAVDDEQLMLNELTAAIREVFPEADIYSEKDPVKASLLITEMAEKGIKIDYVFLEIRMADKNGLEIARQVKSSHQDAVIVFCTAYSEYAYDAFEMFAKGYLLKPITAQKITAMLDEMVHDWRNLSEKDERIIKVQTFGYFEIFVNGRPVHFEREKAKELLAFLVDRQGSAVTTEQIAAVLWEDRPYDKKMKNYVSTMLTSLKKSLQEVGIDDILVKTWNHLALDVTKIDCDAYEYESMHHGINKPFGGEYMANYSWAESTAGKYALMEQERKR